MSNSVAKRIAFYGVMTALLFVTLLLETYIFIYFIKPSPAFISIPLAISLSIFYKKKTMLFGGTALGLCSFACAFIVGYTVFFNPLISILPRVLVGLVSCGVYSLVLRLTDKMKNDRLKKIIPACVAGAAGVISNTVLVLTMMWAFNEGALTDVFTVILTFNFLLEFLSAVIFVPVLTSALQRVSANRQ